MNYQELLNNNKIRFLYVSLAMNAATGVIKLMTAGAAGSVLFALSGIYNFALCMARAPYIRWNRQSRRWNLSFRQRSEKRALWLMSAVIVLLGVLFAAFGLKMLLTGEEVRYSKFNVLVLALCAFVKLGCCIVWIAKRDWGRGPMDFALKLTNLSDALVSLVLTQSALLVLMHVVRSSYYDGLFGIGAGVVVVVIGLVSLKSSEKMRKTD